MVPKNASIIGKDLHWTQDAAIMTSVVIGSEKPWLGTKKYRTEAMEPNLENGTAVSYTVPIK